MDYRRRDRFPRGSWPNWIGPLLAIGFIIVSIQLIISVSRPKTVDYSEFRKLVSDGKVEEVTIGPSEINGVLKPTQSKEPEEDREFRTARGSIEEDDGLLPLLDAHDVKYSSTEEPNPLRTVFLWFLPTVAIVVLLYFLLIRRLGGSSAMTFGRSRAKLYAQEDVDVSFDDVAGIDEAVEELREVVDFLRTPEKYQAMGGRIPRGVLLVGMPGTGKTLLARAVAGEAGVSFFSLSGSDFVEMFVGVGAARVRDLFGQAQQRAPCIIFVDELDALGKTRSSGWTGGHEEREQTLNQLLVEIDGFDSNRGVIIMAATNRPETLDPALMRPGRFDRHVVVDRPDINGREAILKVHARHVKIDDDLDMRAIAALTPGFVGADLANLVNESALLAAREGSTRVQRTHFEEAIERGVAGLMRKQRVMMPEEKRRIAYHECGHAIVAYLIPGADPVHKISIIPRGFGALGYTLQRPLDDRYLATQTQLENRICTLLGGMIAEEIVFPDVSTGAQNDLQQLTQIARQMVQLYGMSPRVGRIAFSDEDSPFLGPGSQSYAREFSEVTAREIDEEVKRIVDTAATFVRDILTEHRDALEKLSARVLEKEVLDAEELKEVMDAASPRLVPGSERSDYHPHLLDDNTDEQRRQAEGDS
ncbi:ATP-dependent zinc metalloprotease FtsH 4 [Planctomycetes bacterium Pan216]|uniref:ATP-dependent zinc metalloprotease FtsH n=1 Tax=Kolteria novifilia TaxID=2527975 RepID=A0A518B286_9BACT|nr:ATP-dependent zinc metalloprotease FtsH 4 [Planctomycetes bacterium Pan216]